MKSGSPPEKLPESYFPIWKALSQKEQREGSRQALANSVRISTGTIHRILTSGDVPDFKLDRSARKMHAWVKTLARIASATGNDPRQWINGVHIPWTDRIQEVLDRALREIRSHKEFPQLNPYVRQTPPSLTGPVRIAIADFPPLSTRLPNYQGSFLEELAHLLFGSMFAGRPLHFQVAGISEIYREFSKENPHYHFGIGLTWNETAASHHHHSIPIYGLKLPTGTLMLHRVSPQNRDGKFPATSASKKKNQPYFMICRETFSFYYLTRIRRIPSEQLIIRSDEDLNILAEDFLHETANRPNNHVVLFHNELICRKLRKILEANKKAIREFRFKEVPTDINFGGESMIGIGFTPAAEPLYHQARRVLETEINGPVKPVLEDLFESFRKMSEDTHILIDDKEGIQVTASVTELISPEDIRYCRSCMMPLDKFHCNQGLDEYCSMCHDGRKLLPKYDITIMISERLRKMHGNISRREAVKKAKRFMSVMPAWLED